MMLMLDEIDQSGVMAFVVVDVGGAFFLIPIHYIFVDRLFHSLLRLQWWWDSGVDEIKIFFVRKLCPEYAFSRQNALHSTMMLEIISIND